MSLKESDKPIKIYLGAQREAPRIRGGKEEGNGKGFSLYIKDEGRKGN
jgi:hypothetical protein